MVWKLKKISEGVTQKKIFLGATSQKWLPDTDLNIFILRQESWMQSDLKIASFNVLYYANDPLVKLQIACKFTL